MSLGAFLKTFPKIRCHQKNLQRQHCQVWKRPNRGIGGVNDQKVWSRWSGGGEGDEAGNEQTGNDDRKVSTTATHALSMHSNLTLYNVYSTV